MAEKPLDLLEELQVTVGVGFVCCKISAQIALGVDRAFRTVTAQKLKLSVFAVSASIRKFEIHLGVCMKMYILLCRHQVPLIFDVHGQRLPEVALVGWV